MKKRENAGYKPETGFKSGLASCERIPKSTGRNDSKGPNQKPTHPRPSKSGVS